MTNPYGTTMQPQDMAYQQMYPMYPQEKKRGVLPSVLAASAGAFVGIGGITAGVDYFKNRKPVKNGEVTDSFAKKVYEKMVDKNLVAKGKEFCKQKMEVLKGLRDVSTPEAFTKLMKKFKKYTSTLCEGVTFETMCKTVNKDNIKEKAEAFIKKIEASIEPEIQNVKDAIKACWDSDKKKFVKSPDIDKKLYKIIENTKNSVNWKKAGKFGGIAAGIAGALTLGYAGMVRYAEAKQLAALQQMPADIPSEMQNSQEMYG